MMLAKLQPTERVPDSLDDVLVFLTRFGSPRLGIYGNGGNWHCSVEMHVSSQGAKFEIKSDFSHATPLEAASVCAERVVQTLRDLGV